MRIQIFFLVVLVVFCAASSYTVKLRFANGQEGIYTNTGNDYCSSRYNSCHDITYRSNVVQAWAKYHGTQNRRGLSISTSDDGSSWIMKGYYGQCCNVDQYYYLTVQQGMFSRNSYDSYIIKIFGASGCRNTGYSRRMKFKQNWVCNGGGNNHVPAINAEVTSSIGVASSSNATISVSFRGYFTAIVGNSDECRVTSMKNYWQRSCDGGAWNTPTTTMTSSYGAGATVEGTSTLKFSPCTSNCPYYSIKASLTTADGKTASSGTKTFCINAHPTAPSLSSPGHGTTIQVASASGNKVSLFWSGPESWGFSCSSTSKTYSVKFSGSTYSTTSTSYSVTIPTLSQPLTTFTWSVTAQMGSYTKASDSRSFVMLLLPKTGTPSITSPSGNQDSTSVTASWSHSNWGSISGLSTSGFRYAVSIVDTSGKSYLNKEVKWSSGTSSYSGGTVTISTTNQLTMTVKAIGYNSNTATATRTFKICSIAPSAPSSFSADSTSVICTSAFSTKLSWSAVSNWGSTCSSTKRYRITGATSASTASTSYTVPGLTCKDTTHTYNLVAFNGNKDSVTKTVTVKVCSYITPQPPTSGFSQFDSESTRIAGQDMTFQWDNTAQWGKICPDGNSKLYRVEIWQGSTTKTLTTGTNSVVTQVPSGGKWSWRVYTINSNVVSAASATQSFTPCVLYMSGVYNNLNAVFDVASGNKKVTFGWELSNSFALNTTNMCAKNINFWFVVSVLDTNNKWVDIDSQVAIDSTAGYTEYSTTMTHTFDTAPKGMEWHVSVRNNIGAPIVASEDEILSYDGVCTDKPPVFTSTAITVDRTWFLYNEPISVTWSASSLGRACNDVQAVLTYEIMSGNNALHAGIERTTLRYTYTKGLPAGRQNIWVKATNGGASSQSDKKEVCALPQPQKPTISVSSTEHLPPFAVSWKGVLPSEMCGQKAWYFLYLDDKKTQYETSTTQTTYKIHDLTDGSHTVKVELCVGESASGRHTCTMSDSKTFSVCNYESENVPSVTHPDLSGYVDCTKDAQLKWTHTKIRECIADSDLKYTVIEQSLVDGSAEDTLIEANTTNAAMDLKWTDYGTYSLQLRGCNKFFCSDYWSGTMQCCTPDSGTFAVDWPVEEELFLNINTTIVNWTHQGFNNCARSYTTYVVIWNSTDVFLENVPFSITTKQVETPQLQDDQTYYWKVVMESDEDSRLVTESDIGSFRTCWTTQPVAPSGLYPGNDTSVAADGEIELKWEHDEWGKVCIEDCDKIYMVYISDTPGINTSSALPSYVTTDHSVKFAPEDKTYYWIVAAQTSTGGVRYTEEHQFYACQNTPPLSPIVYSPRDSMSIRKRDGMTFKFYDTENLFGVSCLNQTLTDPGITITVYSRQTQTEVKSEWKDMADIPIVKDPYSDMSFYEMRVDTFDYGAFSWDAALQSPIRFTTISTRQVVFICDSPDVSFDVTFEEDVNRTDDSEEDDDEPVIPYRGVVVWPQLTKDMFGFPCGENAEYRTGIKVIIKAIRTKTETRDDESLGSADDGGDDEEGGDGGEVREVVHEAELLDTAYQFTLEPDMLPDNGGSYVLTLVVSNGEGSLETKELNFRVEDNFCGVALTCTEHGTCNDAQRVCECDEGWSGQYCQLQGVVSKSIVGPVVGSVAGVIVLIALSGFLILLVYARKNNKSIMDVILKGPKDRHRFVVIPELPTDENAWAVMEKAIKNDGEELVKAMQICNTAAEKLEFFDDIIIAMVYTYKEAGWMNNLMLQMTIHELRDHSHSGAKTAAFYENSATTTAFKIWSRMNGVRYLFNTFHTIFKKMVRQDNINQAHNNQGLLTGAFSFELNAQFDEDGGANVFASTMQVCVEAQSTIDALMQTARLLPIEFTRYFDDLWNALLDACGEEGAMKLFQETVAGLFFHRFLMFALLDPVSYGILDEVSDEMHDKLNVISKVLMKLAYQEVFGEREQTMANFNTFIEERIFYMTEYVTYLTQVHKAVRRHKSENASVPKKTYESSLNVLCTYCPLY